jgi:hypothetical protein
MLRFIFLVIGVILLEGAFNLSAEATWAIFLIAIAVAK